MIVGEIEIVPAGANSMEGWNSNTEENGGGGMRGSAKGGRLFRNLSHGPEVPLRTCDSLGEPRMIIDPRHRMTRADFSKGNGGGGRREVRLSRGDEVSRSRQVGARSLRGRHFVCSFVIDESRVLGGEGGGRDTRR